MKALIIISLALLTSCATITPEERTAFFADQVKHEEGCTTVKAVRMTLPEQSAFVPQKIVYITALCDSKKVRCKYDVRHNGGLVMNMVATFSCKQG